MSGRKRIGKNMSVGTRTARVSKAQLKFKMRRHYAVGKGQCKKKNNYVSLPPLTRICRGAFNRYPCLMTISDLSTNAVTLMPGVYITSTRACEMGTIRKTLHDIGDNFWDTLKLCVARNHDIASGDIACLVFCHWASSLYNSKLMSGFCHVARDTLTITIYDDSIRCCAFKLKACAAKNLLDIMACVELASGLISPNEQIGGARVEVTTTDIDRFSVCFTVKLCPSYMEDVKMNESRFYNMYGHLVAEFR